MKMARWLIWLTLLPLPSLSWATPPLTAHPAAVFNPPNDAAPARRSALVAKAAPKPLNFVVLFADDLGYGDLSSYGHPTIDTPNLDGLARAGQRWTSFYAAAPVCSPSRGALLTGRLPVRTGLYGERIAVFFPNDETGAIPEAETTIAEALQAEGYATAIIGKWHLGDALHAYPTRHGFDYWYGLPYSNDMDWAGVATFDDLMRMNIAGEQDKVQAELALRRPRYFAPQNAYWNVPLIESTVKRDRYEDKTVARPPQQADLTTDYTERAVGFINKHAKQPFFLYVPYAMPHTPLFVSEARTGRSRASLYGDVIEELDWSVGEIVDALRAKGLFENTLILFTSDNGPWLTMNLHGGSAGHLNNGKGTTFEGGMRVPAIFAGGPVKPGVVRDMGSTLDLYATIAAFAGLDASHAADSFDLSATLTEQVPSPREALAYYRAGELQAFRLGEWKLQLIAQGAYGQPPERAVFENPRLFNLEIDPGERFDVAADNPAIVAKLRQAVADHRAAFERAAPIFDQRLNRLLAPTTDSQ